MQTLQLPRIAAEKSLSLLTMTNKAFSSQNIVDRLTLVNYIFHKTQLRFLSWPYSVMITGLLAQVLRNMYLSCEILNGNTQGGPWEYAKVSLLDKS